MKRLVLSTRLEAKHGRKGQQSRKETTESSRLEQIRSTESKRGDRLASSGRKRPHTQRKPVLSHLDEAGEWPISRNRPRQARNEATVIRQARNEATAIRQ